MTLIELEHLSKPELIDLVLRLQRGINLRWAEATDHAYFAPPPARPPFEQRHTVGPETDLGADPKHNCPLQAMRQALRNLGDIAFLERSNLALMIARRYGTRPSGSALQWALSEAIEASKFVRTHLLPYQPDLAHAVLRRTYLEKQRVVEIARSIPISERQYYRVLKAGIQTITNLMFSAYLQSWQKSGRKGVE